MLCDDNQNQNPQIRKIFFFPGKDSANLSLGLCLP